MIKYCFHAQCSAKALVSWAETKTKGINALSHPLTGLTVMAYGSPAMSVISRVQFGPLSWPTLMEYLSLVQWAV